MQKGHDRSPYGNTAHSISRREFMKAMASLSTSGAILSSASGDLLSSYLRDNLGNLSVRHLFPRDFAPSERWTKPVEDPFRQDICLNGLWQFQPVPVPGDWARDTGTPPVLPAPSDGKWETTLIKIPSPWNVNTWGSGRDAGPGTGHPYWPSSMYFPSYPVSWDGVEMGWLRRSFRVPNAWSGKRLVLHFEAVGGNAQIYVNGHKAGEYFDRYLPFDLDITDLVTQGESNELLVGIRSLRLFDQKSAKFKHMRTPYPPGSTTDNLVGIWQDVYLLALPVVRISDVFIKPFVDQNILEWDVTITNETIHTQNLEVSGNVHPWVNLAGSSVLDAPEPKWRLDPPVLKFPLERISMKPGESRTVTLKQKASNRLKLWTPDTPNLYGLLATITIHGKAIDRHYTRFGWRQTRISGADFFLNGKKTALFGDLLHPFGPFICSRRYAWSWYRMIKDMHGNAVRLHAQPHPRHYLDIADEMGLLVLDETALFGSSLQLNFEAPEAWDRFAKHYDNMILRDRNHPSVFGWSCGNELFAIFIYDDAITKDQADIWYEKLGEYGLRALRLDPTRDWISCDGDEDLRGKLPVWSKHFGLGLPLPEWLPKEPAKPLMVGESGGSYYARPSQLAIFNGDRAYSSYQGRNEALAIDVYDNVVKLARPRLAYFSASETAWFGIEHLSPGYTDFTRLPNGADGVWFQPFAEGKPGMQLEHIPPYVCTFNPGWDPSLPVYKPLAMFDAQKAAQAPGMPEPSRYDHREVTKVSAVVKKPDSIEKAAFAGGLDNDFAVQLTALGCQLVQSADIKKPKILIIPAESVTEAAISDIQNGKDATLANKGIVLLVFRKRGDANSLVNQLLPSSVVLTARHATALTPRQNNNWTSGLDLPTLYFAEDSKSREIMKFGLGGDFVTKGNVLLEASNTDWSLFNDMPEFAKCGSVIQYEKMKKPSGAALVAMSCGGGTIAVTSIECIPESEANAKLWRTLISNMGVKLDPQSLISASNNHAAKEHNLLLNGPDR